MDKLYIPDVWLFARFEKFAHRWQRLTGLTCFWLFRCSFALSYVAMCADTLSGVSSYADGRIVYVVMNTIAYAVVWVRFRIVITYVERTLKAGATRNPVESVGRPIRSSLLIVESFMMLSALELSQGMFALHIICFVSALYFVSCTPLPPSKSTVRKLVEKGLAALSGALPEPVPQGVGG